MNLQKKQLKHPAISQILKGFDTFNVRTQLWQIQFELKVVGAVMPADRE